MLSHKETDETKRVIITMKSKPNFDYKLPDESNNEDRLGDQNEFLCGSESSNSMMYCRFQLTKAQVKSNVQIMTRTILIPFLSLCMPIMNKKLNNVIENCQSNATVE